MKYIFDSNSFVQLFRNYYPERFPTLWDKFNDLVSRKMISSVREAANEINSYYKVDRLSEWVDKNPDIFEKPTIDELNFVKEIFSILHFQDLIRKKERLQGKPVADPFIIAKAKIHYGYVVTEETYKENGVSIPNVCEHFKIQYTNLEGFMIKENWVF